MFKKSILSIFIFCTSLTANQSFDYQLDKYVSCANLVEGQGINEHFTTVRDRVKDRWQAFQRDQTFKPFKVEKPDSLLEEEFENIQSTRSFVWTTSGYELAQHLVANDLVRAPGCVAFAYNNTVPYYNASTMCLNDQYHIACEGPRSKDIPKFFDLLTTYQVTHLVRLTDSYEGDRKKCHPYWESA